MCKCHAATDRGNRIESLRNSIRKHWGEASVAAIAIRIIDSLREKAVTEGTVLYLSELNELAGTPMIGDVIPALAILTQSEFSILRSGGELIDENGDRFTLSAEEFQQVLDTDTIIHPHTKAELRHAQQQVVPIFRVVTDLFGSREE